MKETNTNGFTSEYGYDINNNINTYKYILTNKNNSLQYNYDKANRLTYLKLNNNITWTNTMDKLSRLSANKITSASKTYTTNYTYTDVPNVTNKTTTLLKTIKNGSNSTITYTYDALGNIETIKKGSTLTNKYYYDELSQLIREDNALQNKTITYEYDVGGNLLNKKEYSYTTSSTLPTTVNNTITYTYGNTNWKDQLTKYNGKQITYDAIGNPLTYDGNTYTWQNGRQLAGISNTTKNQTITYKYNDSGIRTQKTVNGTTTNYYLDGTKVIYEKTGNNVIYYTYDENGRVIALKYNDTQYYYIRNGQNDIVGILDSNLNQIVSYEYDSWGKLLSIKDENGNNITSSTHIGIINPYRYRSYRYDTETGLYYLQSRYYNPEWGRFINQDALIQTGQGILDKNMFAYCMNNPILNYDPTGEAVLISVVFGVCAVISGIVTFTTILYQDKQNGYETNYVDAVARSIVNAGTFYGAGVLASDIGNSGGTYGIAKEVTSKKSESTTFVPQEYWTRNAPKITTPNSKIEHLKLNMYTNQIEKSNVIYDFAGRQIFRIDYTNHGRINHTNPHLHEIRWNSIFPKGIESRYNLK